MAKIETKADLKVGKYYRTTDIFFQVDNIIDGEPHGRIYDIFQTNPIIVANYPLGLYADKVGCIEIFEKEYDETFQRIIIKNRDNEKVNQKNHLR